MIFATDLATAPKLLRIKCEWVSARKRGNPQNLIHKTSIWRTIPMWKLLLLWLRDFQVSFFLFSDFRNAKLLFWNIYFLFNVPSQIFLPETINESAQKSLGKSSFQCNSCLFLQILEADLISHTPPLISAYSHKIRILLKWCKTIWNTEPISKILKNFA